MKGYGGYAGIDQQSCGYKSWQYIMNRVELGKMHYHHSNICKTLDIIISNENDLICYDNTYKFDCHCFPINNCAIDLISIGHWPFPK